MNRMSAFDIIAKPLIDFVDNRKGNFVDKIINTVVITIAAPFLLTALSVLLILSMITNKQRR